MTTSKATTHPQRTGLRRQQLVNAAVVGTVVVILGFASGLGVDTPSTAAIAAQSPATTPTPTPSPSTHTPIQYVGTPEAEQPQPAVVPVVVTVTPSTSPHTGHAVAPTPSPSPTPSGSPSCPGDLLSTLLNSVLSLVDGLLGDSLLGGANPLPGLSSLLGGPTTVSVPKPLTADQVMALMATTSPDASPQVTTACTDAVLNTLPLISGLR